MDTEKVGGLLKELGIELPSCDGVDTPVKVVVVQASMEAARAALSSHARDQVVMARVDSDTARDLDRWVEVGMAKSRSEAAALFIREGLNLRRDDLARLDAALEDLEAARERLRREAGQILGKAAPSPGDK